MKFNKDVKERRFTITLQPMPYKLLEADPQADLVIAQKYLLD